MDPSTERHRFKSWLDKGRRSVLLSFIMLAIVGGWAIRSSAESNADKLYGAVVGSCERANDLRIESNDRIAAHRLDTLVLRSFLLDAAGAREAAFARDGNPSDKLAAEAYRDLANSLKRVRFTPLPRVECIKVIEKP